LLNPTDSFVNGCNCKPFYLANRMIPAYSAQIVTPVV
jgi:hypothetical protein